MKVQRLCTTLLFASIFFISTAQVSEVKDIDVQSQNSELATTTDQTNMIIAKYAKKLGVSDSLLKNPELYKMIDSWVGTPYKYGGSSKKGTDCSGFVGQIMKNFVTTPLPRSASEMSKVVELKKINELQEGDLVFFNLGKTPNRHVGIYLQNGWFVHASSYKGVGVTLSNLNSTSYQRRFSKCGSLKL